MTITIGTLTIDHVDCDLSVGEPCEPADSYGTTEGHNVRYDDSGQVIALTLVNAKWLLERDGEVRVTIPNRVAADTLALALAA